MSYDPRAGELIGKRAKVIKSVCPEYIGIEGLVVDETLKTLVIETKRGRKRIPKADVVLEVEGKRIKGREILYRPWERTKKVMRWARKGRKRRKKRSAMTRSVRTMGK